MVLAACDSGNPGEFGGRLGSVAQMLHRAGFAAVVASRYPLTSSGSVNMTQAFYSAWIKRKKSLGSAFVEARTALTDDATSLDWASLQLYSRGTHSLMQPTPEPARRL
ncbi:MAG: CHAT domain-containing protein, partial [Nannocystaceae bacterium]